MTGAERGDDLPDDTIRVPRPEVDAGDHTVRIPRTASSPSGQPPVEPGADEPEPPIAAAPADLDDATAISRGRPGDETQPAEHSDGRPGPRRHAGAADAGADASDADELDDGSTMVARRESRRRAAREDLPVAPAPLAENTAADLAAPTGRIAQVPGESPPIYKPRPPEPVISERSAPRSRPPQPLVDTRAEILYRRRRARRLALVAVIGGCFVVTVLLAALVAFTSTLGS